MEAALAVKEEIPKQAKPTKIKKLVLDGFKSFGKYTELILGDDFNVVVGPNGSGKSNIMDALCFVLGKSSSKQLRAEKSANLIYNGGKSKEPAKAAEVSIVFDNSNNVFPLAEKEVKVSRIVRADGASKYKINGTTRTRQEVIELLSNAKIDPDGYNIILQGDIVRLVEMSPVERRQIIEEIAGIGMYEEKKQQALNELQKVGEKLNEAEIILKERESYLKDLKKDRDHALKYKELSDKVKQNKASYLKRQLARKDAELKKVEARSNGFKEKLAKVQEQIAKFRKEIAEYKDAMQVMNSEIERRGEVEQVKLQKEGEHLKIEMATKKTRMSYCKNECGKLEQRRVQLKRSEKETEENIQELQAQKKSRSAELEAIGKTLKDLDGHIKAFKQKHNLADEADIDRKFGELERLAEEKQKEVQVLREKQQMLIREKDKIDFQIATMDEKIAKVRELEDAKKEEIAILRKNKEQFKKIVLELNELLNQDSRDANGLAKARSELHVAIEEEHKLRIRQSSVQEQISTNIAVKKVLEQRNKFGEIYGTVAELGTSESKYATALEIAAAQKLYSVVVDADTTAASAIRYLKQERLGFATFLPLNKVKSHAMKEEVKKILNEKGVHGLAIDLLDFDPKFKNVFSHVFGGTIVVDSLDVAKKLGIGVARMVTLEGDLCEISGAMTGGFRPKKAGSFKEKELAGKLNGVQQAVQDLEETITATEKRRKLNEDKIGQLRELKANVEGDIIREEKSLHIDTSDLEATQTFKDELIKNRTSVEKELQEIEEKAGEEVRKVTNLKIEKEQLRSKMSELRNPRVLAELHAFEEKKRQLEQEGVRLDTEQKNTQEQLSQKEQKEKQNIALLFEELIKEDAQFKKEIQIGEEELQKQQAMLEQTEKQQADFFSAFKELFEKRNKLSTEVNEKEGSVLHLEENARKEELSINTHSIEEARMKAEIAGLSGDFEQYAGVELNVEKSEEQLKSEIGQFEKMMATIGSVNLRALEIYETVEKEYGILMEKKKVLLTEKDDVVKLMNEIEGSKKELFMRTLNAILDEFKRIFGQLMTKGESYLELENPQEPFAGGLHINVRLTGNKFLDIRSLSGGEKTMTALAFLFALQEHEPAKFYVLDEVDAALDKHNSEKLAKLIRSYCAKAQYLVISHNDALIAEGDVLYGVTMNTEAGLSSVVSLKV